VSLSGDGLGRYQRQEIDREGEPLHCLSIVVQSIVTVMAAVQPQQRHGGDRSGADARSGTGQFARQPPDDGDEQDAADDVHDLSS
jgi:hypothetical protein